MKEQEGGRGVEEGVGEACPPGAEGVKVRVEVGIGEVVGVGVGVGDGEACPPGAEEGWM